MLTGGLRKGWNGYYDAVKIKERSNVKKRAGPPYTLIPTPFQEKVRNPSYMLLVMGGAGAAAVGLVDILDLFANRARVEYGIVEKAGYEYKDDSLIALPPSYRGGVRRGLTEDGRMYEEVDMPDGSILRIVGSAPKSMEEREKERELRVKEIERLEKEARYEDVEREHTKSDWENDPEKASQYYETLRDFEKAAELTRIKSRKIYLLQNAHEKRMLQDALEKYEKEGNSGEAEWIRKKLAPYVNKGC